MTERLDTERMAIHDIEIIRGRASFTPTEVRGIADKLAGMTDDDEKDFVWRQKVDTATEAVRDIVATGCQAIYTLSQSEMQHLHRDLEELLTLIEEGGN